MSKSFSNSTVYSNRVTLYLLLVLCTALPSFGQDVTKEMYRWTWSLDSEGGGTLDNVYLILYMRGGKIVGGVMNATTDEYDRGREGYECGYSVLPLRDIRESGDTIRFTVRAESERDFFDMPIPPGGESAQYARAKKYPKWSAEHHHTMPFPEVEYNLYHRGI